MQSHGAAEARSTASNKNAFGIQRIFLKQGGSPLSYLFRVLKRQK